MTNDYWVLEDSKRKRIMSKEEREAIAEMIVGGTPINKIAKKVKRSIGTVYNVRKSLKSKKHNQKVEQVSLTPNQANTDIFSIAKSLSEIAAVFKTDSIQEVIKYLKDYLFSDMLKSIEFDKKM